MNLTKHFLTIENFDGIGVDYPCVFHFEFFWPVAKQLKDCLVIVFRLFENTYGEVFFIRQTKIQYTFGSHKNQVKIKIESSFPNTWNWKKCTIRLRVEPPLLKASRIPGCDPTFENSHSQSEICRNLVILNLGYLPVSGNQ